MSAQATSTKPNPDGTFGTKYTQCIYDGSTLRKQENLTDTVIKGVDIYMCPRCGWITMFRGEG